MTRDQVKAILDRVLTWPAAAQKEAIATLKAIEEEFGDPFGLSSDDREALEHCAGDVRHGRFAEDKKVKEVFGRYRHA